MNFWGKGKAHRGFTLIELIVVIILLGIVAVTAAPRFMGRSGFDESTIEARLMATLRLSQHRAMSDIQQNCYGIAISADEVTPIACGTAIDADRVIPIPSSINISVNSLIAGSSTGFYFNSSGCPVSQSHIVTAQECGVVPVEIVISGASTRSICINSQGFIRPGFCTPQ